ncbi:hypothetical protein LXL04_016696 [Taraxacum kok-saghyz]
MEVLYSSRWSPLPTAPRLSDRSGKKRESQDRSRRWTLGLSPEFLKVVATGTEELDGASMKVKKKKSFKIINFFIIIACNQYIINIHCNNDDGTIDFIDEQRIEENDLVKHWEIGFQHSRKVDLKLTEEARIIDLFQAANPVPSNTFGTRTVLGSSEALR